MRVPLVLFLLLMIPVAYAEHINLWLNTNAPANAQQSDTQPLSHYISTNPGGIQSQAWGSSVNAFSADTFPCAYSGILTAGGADDSGTVTITSSSGSASATRSASSAGPLTVSAGGPFDPQTATVSWSNRNRDQQGGMGIGMTIALSYRSQNGYTWDAATNTCTAPATLTGIRASSTTPSPGSDITIFCQASAQDNTIIAKNSTHDGTKGSWVGNELPFTFKIDAVAETFTCTLGTQTKTITITPRTISLFTVTLQKICSPPKVAVSWPVVSGATSYTLTDGNGATRATVTTPQYDIIGVTEGSSVYVKVVANPGKEEGKKTLVFSCAQSETIDKFHHAYFARTGNRNVTAYWVDDDVRIVYRNFATDMSSLGNYALAPGMQTIAYTASAQDVDAVKKWRSITSALRLSAVGAPFTGVIRSAEGYDGSSHTVAISSGKALILYGAFADTGNAVRIGTTVLQPYSQNAKQIEVQIASIAPGTYPVTVENVGLATPPFSITVQ